MKRLLHLLRNLFRKSKVERDLDEELRFHLEMQIEANVARGMNRRDAERKASMDLGGMEQTKERCREARAGHFLETLIMDVRFGMRSLLREPFFVIVVILTLALGIGANTAIFSVTRGVLLRPLPYGHPEKLVMVWNREKDGSLSNTNYATFEDWKANLRSFEGMAAMSYWQPTLTGHGEALQLEGSSVSAGFFKVLGVAPMLGRDFRPEEDRPKLNTAVILSYRLWRNRFGGDPSLIGKQIYLSGIPRTVIGVLPPWFESLSNFNYKDTDIWRPLGYDATLPQACRTCNHLRTIARVREGVELRQAEDELDAFTRILIDRYRQDYGIAGATLVPLQEQFVADVRTVLLVLLGAVGLVLLIACANIANLVLARTTRRSREMAIRTALGAGRSRLMRQLLTETLILSVVAGAIGVLFAIWAKDLIVAHAPKEIPRLQSITLDYGVLLFAATASLFSGLLSGFVPAWKAARMSLVESLNETAHSTASRQGAAFRRSVVVFNLAVALMLLSGAGLLLGSVQNLLKQPLGFQPDHVITMTVSATGTQYEEDEKVHLYFHRVLEQVGALSGVESAGIVSQLPLSNNLDMYSVLVKDKPVTHESDAPGAERFAISSGYLKTLGIPLLRGRGFTEQDRAGAMPVVLVNRTFAEKTWPGEEPVGKQIQIGGPEEPWRTVVGVVEDVRHRGLQEPFALQFYMPYEQWSDNGMTLVVRTTGDPAKLAASITGRVWSVDPNQPISDIAPMNDVIHAALGPRSFALALIELFAVSALLLAALGIYGVMGYTAARRVKEIGIRMALGADRGNVVNLLLRDGVRLTVAGIVLGICGSLLISRSLGSLLFRMHPSDPIVFAEVTLILLGVGCLASLLPALRASRLNPVAALHQE